MNQRRFFVIQNFNEGDNVILPSKEVIHARKVLRLSSGDNILVLDGHGRVGQGVLFFLSNNKAICQIKKILRSSKLPIPKLVICPGLLRYSIMDLLAVKFTELMVDEVRPFISNRSIVRFNEIDKKFDRWIRLATQSIKQCGAARIPVFFPLVELESLIFQAPVNSMRLLIYENEKKLILSNILSKLTKVNQIWVIIGPEGGFSFEEISKAKIAGWTILGLGHQSILRSETANLALVSIIRFGLIT